MSTVDGPTDTAPAGNESRPHDRAASLDGEQAAAYLRPNAGRQVSRPRPGRRQEGGSRAASGGLADGPLGTTTEFVSPPQAKTPSDLQERDDDYTAWSRRRLRIELRRIIWSITTVRRLSACGKVIAQDSEKVTIKVKNGTAYAAGLCVCGSIWLCPVCSAKIRARRADEIARGVAKHIVGGGSAWMVTFTVRHAKGHALADLLDALNDAFRRLGNGKAAQKEKARVGKVGTINSREITYGKNGWHPHLHVIVLFDGSPDLVELGKLMVRWRNLWMDWSKRHGFPADEKHGVKWDMVTTAEGAGEYIAKAQDSGKHIGNEVARGDLKRGKLGSLTPFELIEYLQKTGDAAVVDLWREYEKATKHKAAISWSRGLKALLSVEDTTDEQLAAADVDGEDVAELPEASWKLIVQHGIEADVFEAIETGGFPALVKLLTAHHIWAVKRLGPEVD